MKKCTKQTEQTNQEDNRPHKTECVNEKKHQRPEQKAREIKKKRRPKEERRRLGRAAYCSSRLGMTIQDTSRRSRQLPQRRSRTPCKEETLLLLFSHSYSYPFSSTFYSSLLHDYPSPSPSSSLSHFPSPPRPLPSLAPTLLFPFLLLLNPSQLLLPSLSSNS